MVSNSRARRSARIRRLNARRRTHWRRGDVERLEPRSLLAADVVISELLASNSEGLRDEDGDPSDWVELWNRGDEAADLDGWYLTDDDNELDKWEFPSIELGAGERLIVFASDKDRDLADGELHTNFKLSAGGEYLGLVSSDGSTIIDEYSPEFPEQQTDVSYGIEQSSDEYGFINVVSASTLLLPSSASEDVAAEEWTKAGFDDSSWRGMTAAVGYDDDPNDGSFFPLIGFSGLVNMSGIASGAYFRTPFELTEIPPLTELTLNLNYDDGYVAYLNGTEVARDNAPETLNWQSLATGEHGGTADELDMNGFATVAEKAQLNLLGSAEWAGDRLRITPSEADQTGAAWLSNPITFAEDYSFSAEMSINSFAPGGASDVDGRGGEGMTFVLQSGGENQLGGPGGELGLDSTGMSFVAVEFDTGNTGSFDPVGSSGTHLGITTSAEGNVAQRSVPRFNGSDEADVDMRHVWVEYNGGTKILSVYFSATTSKPSQPSVSARVDFDSIFGGTSELWTGWTAATSDSFNAHDVTDFRITTGAGQEGLTPVAIDLSEHIDLLVEGENVLAIHGMNVAIDDNDFLLRPELVGTAETIGNAKFFSPPTPGEINGEGTEAPSGSVDYSVTTRTFIDDFDVEITAENPNAVIRYTTDGSLPDEGSIEYSGPIRITTSTRLRARAFEPGKGPGPVKSEGYIELASSVARFEGNTPFESNLPVMVFNSFGRNVTSQSTNMVPVTGIFIAPGEDGRANIMDEGEFADRGGMRIRGQTSEGFAKKQFALELWDEFNSDTRSIDAGQVPDKAASFFGLPEESDWVVSGPYSDKTQLNNYLTFLWSNNAGTYAPRARLVEVFLNQDNDTVSYPNDYLGTYVLLEKIKRDSERVDIERLTPEDNTEPEITGGYIWKKDKPGAGDQPFLTSRGQELRMVEPDDRTITTTQKNWLQSYINEFETVLYGPEFADPETGYAAYIDVKSWADTWLLVEMTKNIDGFRLSTYYHKDRLGKIHQGPAWDYNLSLGNGNYLEGAYPEGWYHDGISDQQYPYWDRLFEDPNFEQAVIDRWTELRSTVWSTESLLADIDQAVDMLSDGNPRLDNPLSSEPSNPISRNFDKWGTLNQYLWPNCFFGQGQCPSSPLPGNARPNEYGDYIFIMKDFVERRTAWMDSQLAVGPEISPPGGVVPVGTEVTLDVPTGWDAIYTTNGTDPRDSSAAVNQVRLVEAGNNAVSVHVPSSNALINACYGAGAATDCLAHPDYVEGSHGETWRSGTLGVGFDSATTYEPFINLDVGDILDDVNAQIYLRIPFDVTQDQLDTMTGLQLSARYDDGFVAYVWSETQGQLIQIADANAELSTIPIPFDENATSGNRDSNAIQLAPFDAASALPHLRAGRNYLVVLAFNASRTSSDFLIDVELLGTSLNDDLPDGVFAYDGDPIVIDHNTRINARLLLSTSMTWSGMTSATYQTSAPELAITEINYHPHGPTLEELLVLPQADDGSFEFIEVRNVGTETAYLVGSAFDAGVDFEFGASSLAPGEYGVVVSDIVAFQLRYGDQVNILGQYEGSLNNGGENVRLVDSVGETITSAEYGDNTLWPQASDGLGASLQLRDDAIVGREDKYYSWRHSTEFGGSPGAAGQPAVPVVVNEVLANVADGAERLESIELHNTSSTAQNIGGWYLSDSRNDLFKYRIPAGTIIPAGGYWVVTEQSYNPTPDTPEPTHFGLSGIDGDDIWLTVPTAEGGVQNFVDDVHFGAMNPGQSMGRLPNGQGRLATLLDNSFGQMNGAVALADVQMTELMYHPGEPSFNAITLYPELDENDLEYVELTNTSGAAVDLLDWRLRGGFDFDFQASLMLGPGESVLLLSFNPDSPENASRLAAFKAQYMLGDEVKLVGGYPGSLENRGERLTLEYPNPDLDDNPLVTPRVWGDEVVYDDLPPWPVADGTGQSLQRVAADTHGNSPTNWRVAAPTPGDFEFDGTIPGDFDGDRIVGITDLEMLCSAAHQMPNDLMFDLNGDGVFDDADLDYMVQTLLGTDAGDANLDGIFDSTDLVQVFAAGSYETGPANWSSGDWNCDGFFTTTDLVVAFATGSYVNGAQPASRSLATNAIAAALNDDASSSEFSDHPSKQQTVLAEGPTVQGVELTHASVDSMFAESEFDADAVAAESGDTATNLSDKQLTLLADEKLRS